VRNSERWLALRARFLSAWRARFLACAELAKFITPKNVIRKCWKIEPRNMLVFTTFVNVETATKIGWLFASKPGTLLGFAI
jgi:hypothetical protein